MISVLHVHLGSSGSGVASYIHAFRSESSFKTYSLSLGRVRHKSLRHKYALLLRIIDRRNIDVLYLHTIKCSVLFLPLALYARLKGVRFFYNGHGLRFQQLGLSAKKVVAFCCELVTIGFSDKTIVIRMHDYQVVQEFIPAFWKTKISLIRTTPIAATTGHERQGLDVIRRFEEKVVLCVGYLEKIKGYDFFIDIASRLADTDITFVWIGSEQPQGVDVPHNITFLGRKRREEVVAYIREHASVYLCCSTIETMPMVFFEVIAAGVPIYSRPLTGLQCEFESVQFIDDSAMEGALRDLFRSLEHYSAQDEHQASFTYEWGVEKYFPTRHAALLEGLCG